MKVSEALVPLAAGLASALSPHAAAGIRTTISAFLGMREQDRQRELENQELARRNSVGKALGNLLDDPDAPEFSAAREAARAGDIDTAKHLNLLGTISKAKALTAQRKAGEERTRRERVMDALTPVSSAPAPGEVGPPSRAAGDPEGQRLVDLGKAFLDSGVSPLATAKYLDEVRQPPAPPKPETPLQHIFNDPESGMPNLLVTSHAGDVLKRIPIGGARPTRRSLTYRTDPATGQMFRQTIENGEVVNEEPWGSPVPAKPHIYTDVLGKHRVLLPNEAGEIEDLTLDEFNRRKRLEAGSRPHGPGTTPAGEPSAPPGSAVSGGSGPTSKTWDELWRKRRGP